MRVFLNFIIFLLLIPIFIPVVAAFFITIAGILTLGFAAMILLLIALTIFYAASSKKTREQIRKFGEDLDDKKQS